MLPLAAVFWCALLLEVFAMIGYNLIGERTYLLFRQIFSSPLSTRLRDLRSECMALKTDLGATSAMDEFAKWAKLRRRYDKAFADLESLSKEEGNDRAAFERSVSWGLWLTMWLAQAWLIITYAYVPMFYMPAEWTGPFAYILKLPFAPYGSVSVVFWFFAVKNVVKRIMRMRL